MDFKGIISGLDIGSSIENLTDGLLGRRTMEKPSSSLEVSVTKPTSMTGCFGLCTRVVKSESGDHGSSASLTWSRLICLDKDSVMPRLCRRLMTLMGRGGVAGRSKSIGSGRSLDASRVGRGRKLCCGCRVSSARLMISKAPEVVSLAHPQA
jgi:hypothetical protein